MTQSEFYNLPEVQQQLDIQKTNPYGSSEHKAAFYAVSEIAKDHGVFEEYKKSGGGIDY